MVSAGAHILDIGGQSTRPGAVLVSPEEVQVSNSFLLLPGSLSSITYNTGACPRSARSAGGLTLHLTCSIIYLFYLFIYLLTYLFIYKYLFMLYENCTFALRSGSCEAHLRHFRISGLSYRFYVSNDAIILNVTI
jgi:hypothetical protein